MLDSLLRAAGFTSRDAQALMENLARAACDIGDQRAALELEYGRPPLGLVPHNPAQVPLLAPLDLVADTQDVRDVEAALGKFCTRGHLANIGSVEVELAFQGVAGDQWSGTYVLPPGAALDTSSFAYRKVRLLAVGAAGRVQLLAQ